MGWIGICVRWTSHMDGEAAGQTKACIPWETGLWLMFLWVSCGQTKCNAGTSLHWPHTVLSRPDVSSKQQASGGNCFTCSFTRSRGPHLWMDSWNARHGTISGLSLEILLWRPVYYRWSTPSTGPLVARFAGSIILQICIGIASSVALCFALLPERSFLLLQRHQIWALVRCMKFWV